MTTYIAHFTAKHRFIHATQNSIFIWQQESGEIDTSLLETKIKREAAIHFYRLLSGKVFEIDLKDLSITVCKTEPFSG